jgi:hypothetical protein
MGILSLVPKGCGHWLVMVAILLPTNAVAAEQRQRNSQFYLGFSDPYLSFNYSSGFRYGYPNYPANRGHRRPGLKPWYRSPGIGYGAYWRHRQPGVMKFPGYRSRGRFRGEGWGEVRGKYRGQYRGQYRGKHRGQASYRSPFKQPWPAENHRQRYRDK